MDFTGSKYLVLIKALQEQGLVFAESVRSQSIENQHDERGGYIILRQDIDRLPENSLFLARVQKEAGIRSTFYFRTVKDIFNEHIIREIAEMGHDIGYHYEDLSLVEKRHKAQGARLKATLRQAQGPIAKNQIEREIVELGIVSFERNLERFRRIVPVKSICMHGSPLSKWDSRLLWKYYDYKDFGIESEPYFDVSFEDRLYLTDTGRRWNGGSVSVRDRAGSAGQGARSSSSATADEGEGSANIAEPFADWKRKPIPGSLMNMTPKAIEFQKKYNFRYTKDIISAIDSGEYPEKAMMTFHPHRWNKPGGIWWKEFIGQNIKNSIKYFIIKARSNK